MPVVGEALLQVPHPGRAGGPQHYLAVSALNPEAGGGGDVLSFVAAMDTAMGCGSLPHAAIASISRARIGTEMTSLLSTSPPVLAKTGLACRWAKPGTGIRYIFHTEISISCLPSQFKRRLTRLF